MAALVQATILPDPTQLRLIQLVADRGCITACVATAAPSSPCPLCGQPATRVHSRYVRQVADLPWQGIAFRLELQVRRFVCTCSDCPRTIFTERLPGVVAPYARKTVRLAELLGRVAFALGGAAGRRLLATLGIGGLRRGSTGVSRDTLLRAIRHMPQAANASPPPPRTLGIDDFAFRRGRTYGTILVDLERHCVVDLLAESSAEAATAWLNAQTGIALLSRDRGGTYAEAARLGAPQAMQVADRWHLLHNLGETVQAVFERHRADLRAVARHLSALPAAHGSDAVSRSRGQPSRREEGRVPPPLTGPPISPRQQLFDEAKRLHAQGWSYRHIARHLGLNWRTARKYVLAESLPPRVLPQTTSSVTPYRHFVQERWTAGCQCGRQLWTELRERGYRGSLSSVYRALKWLRTADGRRVRYQLRAEPTPAPPSVRPKSPRQAMWLVVQRPERLTPEDAAYRAALYAICADAAAAAALAQRFAALIREHRPADLPDWYVAAEQSGIPEFQRFAQGLRRDDAAVRLAMSVPWSQGQVEGQITRLKLLKRSMYGRAKLDLLRRRLVGFAAD